MQNTETEVFVSSKVKPGIKEPPMFKVIYINDNHTSMEFVIETLMEYFEYTADTAQKITIDIHEEGAATVAVLPYEIAEQKGIEVTMSARSQNYPLQIKLEPEVN
jgi:ATP-dependent Clp protease adaptor protein ClpS